jgi:hypothetical protein
VDIGGIMADVLARTDGRMKLWPGIRGSSGVQRRGIVRRE